MLSMAICGSNVGEGKWFSSKLHLNWVAKEK